MHLRRVPALPLLLFLLCLLPTSPAEMPHATTARHRHQPPHQTDAPEPDPSPPLALPHPPSATTATPAPHKLDLSNGPVDLSDALGPLVINSDGTTSRITNWHHMTADEKHRTLLIITRRNRLRLRRLKEKEDL